jgi:hypothetical protein
MSRTEDKYNTQIDKELQELATFDWTTFCQMAGEDMILSLKMCYLRRKNSSYGIIQMKLGVTKMQVRHATKEDKCSCDKKSG